MVVHDYLGKAPMLGSKGIYRFFSTFDESNTASTQSVTEEVSPIFKGYAISVEILSIFSSVNN